MAASTKPMTITRRLERKTRGGEVRTYETPQLLITGERLTAAGFKVGEQVVVEVMRGGGLRIRHPRPRATGAKRA